MEHPWPPARVLHLLAITQQTDVLLVALNKYATETAWAQLPAVLAGTEALRFGCRGHCYLTFVAQPPVLDRNSN